MFCLGVLSSNTTSYTTHWSCINKSSSLIFFFCAWEKKVLKFIFKFIVGKPSHCKFPSGNNFSFSKKLKNAFFFCRAQFCSKNNCSKNKFGFVYKQRNKKSLFNGFTFDYWNCLKKVKTLIVEYSQICEKRPPLGLRKGCRCSKVGTKYGSRCYVRLAFLQQFKTDWLRRLEGLVFEKKKFIT